MPKTQFRLSMMSAAFAASFAPQLYAAGAGQVDFATTGVNAVSANGQARPVKRGDEIAPGETIDTGTGRAQLRFTDGGLVSLQPQTQFRLETYGYDKDDPKKNSIVMNLLKGGLRTITGLIGKTNREGYKLQTATATVGIRGTEFSITGFPDGSILFDVADGAIDVSNKAGSSTLNGGQGAYVNNDNTPPAKTDEKPFLPPVVYGAVTQLPTPVNPVQDSQPFTQPLLIGTYNGQWRTALLDGKSSLTRPEQVTTNTFYRNSDGLYYVTDSPIGTTGTTNDGSQIYFGGSYVSASPTFTVGANGHLVKFGNTYGYGGGYAGFGVPTTFSSLVAPGTLAPVNTTYNYALGSATSQSYGNDGVMAWGRWSGGPVDYTTTNDPNAVGPTYADTSPLHYVVGLPVTNVPTSGSATYSMYGATLPSCSGPACNGTITVGGSLSIDFANYAGTYQLGMANSADGAKFNTMGGLEITRDGVNFSGTNNGRYTNAGVALNYAYSTIDGFLAGPGASHAGAVYQFNYSVAAVATEGGGLTLAARPISSDMNVVGAAVFKRGALDTSTLKAGNWATTTLFNSVDLPLQPDINSPKTITPTFTLGSSGQVVAMGHSATGYAGNISNAPTGVNTYSKNIGTAGAQVYGNDGVMAWGRWINGQSTSTSIQSNGNSRTSEGSVYDTSNPLHYVAGLPVTNMPTVGTATYSMYSGTAPSCSGSCTGAISVGSSLNVNFANLNQSSFDFKLANASDGVNLTAAGGLSFTNGTVNFSGSTSNVTAYSGASIQSGSVNLAGFLAGPAASHAGAVYNVNYSAAAGSTAIAGAAVYKR